MVGFVGKVFALKRLKLENEKEGFPITSLREIDMLLKAKHPNIVGVHVRTHIAGSLHNNSLQNWVLSFGRRLYWERTWIVSILCLSTLSMTSRS